MLKQLIPAFRIALILTVLTGLLYPGIVTAICRTLFPGQANGSLIVKDGRILGSGLIGQKFSRPEYFHPRPSAAGSEGYDAASSGGTNWGPTNEKLINRVKNEVEKFRKENPDYHGPIPADIVTASGSGLDPDISPASAYAQAFRVAKARGVPVNRVKQIIARYIKAPTFGFLGDARVNVLILNMALDRQIPPSGARAAGL